MNQSRLKVRLLHGGDDETSNTSLSTYFTYAKDESNNITKYVKRHLERTYKEDVKTWTPAMVAEFVRELMWASV